jgi:hypothetical protein
MEDPFEAADRKYNLHRAGGGDGTFGFDSLS